MMRNDHKIVTWEDEGDFEFEDVSIPALGLTATLKSRKGSTPVRAIKAGRQAKPVGRYWSVKCGRPMVYESPNELLGFYHAEVDSNVVSYLAQPHTMQLDLDGWRDYTPDREDALADGVRRVVEIKRTYEKQRDPLYGAKLDRALIHYTHSGRTFEIVERQRLVAEPRFSTVEQIQTYRRTSITADDLRIVRSLFGQSDTITLAAVKTAFACDAIAITKVSAMIVRRLVGIDLDAGLNDDTLVFRVRI